MKKPLLRFSILALGAATLLAFLFHARAQKNRPEKIAGSEAHIYKKVGDAELRLFVFKPVGWMATDKRPAAVFFFGGGWSIGNPSQFTEHCKFLADRGMVAITADYRVKSRHNATGSDCVADARDAVGWVRENAGRLGIDPMRLGAGGGSAGGHIAACLGTVGLGKEEFQNSIPNALFLFNPACVLAPIDGEKPWSIDLSKTMEKRMGVPPVELSPAHHVKTGHRLVLFFTAWRTASFRSRQRKSLLTK